MDTLQIVFATLSLSVPVLLGWLLHSVSTLHRDVGNLVGRFEQMGKRFEQMNKRFEQMDKRFEQMDKRVGNIESKLGAA